jgi:UDP-N-acetylglucosamine:LPS N-acetylglucosamine transferase
LTEKVGALFADRGRLEQMGQAAKNLAHPNAAQDVAKMAAALVKDGPRSS